MATACNELAMQSAVQSGNDKIYEANQSFHNLGAGEWIKWQPL